MTVNDFDEAEVGNDKVTIGPSASNKDVLDLLVTQGHFNSSLAAFQAAAMLAIRKDLEAGSAPSAWEAASSSCCRAVSRSVPG